MQTMTQTNFGVILTLFAKVIDHLRQSTKEKQQQQQKQQQNSPLLLGRRRSFGSRASKNYVRNLPDFGLLELLLVAVGKTDLSFLQMRIGSYQHTLKNIEQWN